MNDSINQTLSRTILTSAVTLIPILCLFFFGGPFCATSRWPSLSASWSAPTRPSSSRRRLFSGGRGRAEGAPAACAGK